LPPYRATREIRGRKTVTLFREERKPDPSHHALKKEPGKTTITFFTLRKKREKGVDRR